MAASQGGSQNLRPTGNGSKHADLTAWSVRQEWSSILLPPNEERLGRQPRVPLRGSVRATLSVINVPSSFSYPVLQDERSGRG